MARDTLIKAYKFSRENRLIGVSLSVFIAIVTLAIVQDYFHSARNDHPFFFSESLLFKTFWFYFPPILLFLKYATQKLQIKTPIQMGLALITATFVHLILVPLTIWCLSAIFREQSYGFFKVLTYTLANDIVILLLIYGGFLVWLKNGQSKEPKEPLETQASTVQYLTLNSGKDTTRIKLSDILYIKSSSPYIAIQLDNKQYLHSESLKSIGEKLDDRFVRVHKSSIVNIDKVNSYKSRLNGDYDLTLQDGTELRLSRNYVNPFKSRFKSGPQVNP